MSETTNETKQTIENLTLALMVLTGWSEENRKVPGTIIFRTWNGYRYEAINDLENNKYLKNMHGFKSIVITPEGLTKAFEIINKLGLHTDSPLIHCCKTFLPVKS